MTLSGRPPSSSEMVSAKRSACLNPIEAPMRRSCSAAQSLVLRLLVSSFATTDKDQIAPMTPAKEALAYG